MILSEIFGAHLFLFKIILLSMCNEKIDLVRLIMFPSNQLITVSLQSVLIFVIGKIL